MKSIEKKWGTRPKPGAREDCFGFNKNAKRCEVMKETFCRYGECAFYKESGTLYKGCQNKGDINTCAACYELRGKYI